MRNKILNPIEFAKIQRAIYKYARARKEDSKKKAKENLFKIAKKILQISYDIEEVCLTTSLEDGKYIQSLHIK